MQRRRHNFLLRPVTLLLRRVPSPDITSSAGNYPSAAAESTSSSARLHSSSAASTSSYPPRPLPSSLSFLRRLDYLASSAPDLDPGAAGCSFNDWFKRPGTVHDQIYAILSSVPHGPSLDSSLSALGLRLDEQLVLRTLHHQPRRFPAPPTDGVENDVLLLRLNFFDWAGRQPCYRHTRATYHAIFKLLSRAPHMSTFMEDQQHLMPYSGRIGFQKMVVVGYALAGRLDTALQVLGRMRFQGIDLDAFSYHVLLNALVERGSFDVAETVLAQLVDRGHANSVTALIRIKSLCKRGEIVEARQLLFDQAPRSSVAADRAAGVLVEALCRVHLFDEASHIVDNFGGSRCYSIWIKNLVSACKVGGAAQFLHSKRVSEDYVPELFNYNRLILQLFQKDHLQQVYGFLVEMRDIGVTPDHSTVSLAICFFCKVGMADVALQLYASRHDFGITPNSMAFNHLIDALCSDGKTSEACLVLEEAMRQGCFVDIRIFGFLVDLLFREGKLDEVGKVLSTAMQRSKLSISSACSRYVSALCKAGRMREAYLVVSQYYTAGVGTPLSKQAYLCLIYGYIALGTRDDTLCRLLMEMQDNGHTPSNKLYRDCIRCLCQTGSFKLVLDLLERQMSRKEQDRVYNYFITGLVHAGQHQLAKQVFEMMLLEAVEPSVDSRILLLLSFIKSQQVGGIFDFFNEINSGHQPNSRMYSIMIVGLCKARKPDPAVLVWEEVRRKGIIPSRYCYEELVRLLCSCKDYQTAVKVIKDFERTGLQFSPFLCNVLLSHTLMTREFRRAWCLQFGDDNPENEPLEMRDEAGRLLLGELIAAFSGGIRMTRNLDRLDEVIEKFFPVNLFTHNMLLKALAMEGRMEYACNLFNRICKKGFVPNKWTHDIMVSGFRKNNWRRTLKYGWRECPKVTSTLRRIHGISFPRQRGVDD